MYCQSRKTRSSNGARSNQNVVCFNFMRSPICICINCMGGQVFTEFMLPPHDRLSLVPPLSPPTLRRSAPNVQLRTSFFPACTLI